MRRPVVVVALVALVVQWGLCEGALQAPSGAGISTGGPSPFTRRVLEGAKAEARRAPEYLEEYTVLAYPNGDVPADRGVCTLDLQRAVHEDIKANRDKYPKIWDRKAPDRNIDHRRCPNLATWFRRHAASLPTALGGENLRASWHPGDVVFYVRPKATHPWHVGIVSDVADTDGMPMIIDSFPPRTSESHRLDEFVPIHSHFRLEKLP